MKVMKKILTILFALMMVLMTTTMVFADEHADTTEGVSPTNKGTIKITNAIKDQEYKVYKIFDLDSYSGTNYSYKVVDKWTNFFARGGGGNSYITLDNDGYIKSFTLTEADAPDFAKKALEYAKDASNGVSAISDTPTVTNNPGGKTQTITYNNVDMGYYLIDSSVGSLCSLNTTNLTATITEKNSVPTIYKGVGTIYGDYETTNTAEIGQTVYFTIDLYMGDGPQNYVLHDVMDSGLTYDSSSLKISFKKSGASGGHQTLDPTNYTLSYADGHTFDIEFKQTFLDGLKKNDNVWIEYSAKLNENAVIGSLGNKNKVWVSYGDNKTTTEKQTITRTFGIPVFKFYKTDITGTTSEQPLANVKFKLSSNADADLSNNTDFIKFVKDATTDVYQKALDTDAAYNTELVSNNLGKITLQGLAAGTYYLYETETDKGYNKLTKPVQIEIKSDGKIEYANKGETLQAVGSDGLVKVENKTGTLLPSTGGVGTTMMYIVGVALLIGSGMLLITKKNAK